ncbi:MAG TPA: hypothetical protein VEL47_06970 [Myxococcota bacterium]|nr:hypothetical protein [Myxococcota bacterium]
MVRNFLIPLLFLITMTAAARATILDQARNLLDICEQKQTEHVGLCIAHSLRAVVDIIFFVPIGFLDTIFPDKHSFYHADSNRKDADDFDRTRRSLKKLVAFLEKVETAYTYLAKVKENDAYLETHFGKKFKIALNELKTETESEIDTIKRIHTINRSGKNALASLAKNTDYYETTRASFCYTPITGE